MSPKTIVIIGAGIAGLSTACYARLNGYGTLLLEQHDRPGGLCASWQRGAYRFDYCLHHLAGTAPHSPLHAVWQTLGALDDVPILNDESLVRIEGPGGEVLELYRDLGRLETHLRELAPRDDDVIRRYVGAVRRLAGADLFSLGLGGPGAMVRLAGRLPLILRYGGLPLQQLARQFTDPWLQRALPHAQYNITGPEMPALPHMLFLGALQRGDLGWPVGGSAAMAQRIAARYQALGGASAYRARVSEILVEGNRACGVRLADGTVHRADIVVSAADGYTTIYHMLGGRYTNAAIDAYYRAVPERQAFGLTVYLGVDGDLADAPRHLTLLYAEPGEIAGTMCDSLYVETFGHETGLVPRGKWVVKAVTEGAYAPWRDLRQRDPEAYREAKHAVAKAVAQRLDERWPGLASKVEAWDVVTPVTVERYTGSLHGWQPWGAPEGGMKVMFKGLSKTLPGLSGFYHVGQWSSAMIGLSNAALSGRALVRGLCREDGRRFEG